MSSSWIAAFAPTSTPRVGSSAISTLGEPHSHFAKSAFCWFPPDRERTGAARLRARMSTLAGDLRDCAPLATAARRTARVDNRREVRQRDVLPDRAAHQQPLILARLGQHRDPGAHRVAWLAHPERLAVEVHRAGVEPVGAEDRPRDLGAAGADQSGEPEDLAGVDVERDVLEGALPRRAPGRRARPRLRPAASALDRMLDHHVAADHRRDEAVAPSALAAGACGRALRPSGR